MTVRTESLMPWAVSANFLTSLATPAEMGRTMDRVMSAARAGMRRSISVRAWLYYHFPKAHWVGSVWAESGATEVVRG